MLFRSTQLHEDHTRDSEIRISIDKAIASSPDLRNKKELIDDFIDQLSPEKNVNDNWQSFVKDRQKQELDAIIAEEKLKPEPTYNFVTQSFRNGAIEETGTAITSILPPMPLFAPKGATNKRGEKKQTVIEKLKSFFDKFFDISGGMFEG